MARFKLDGAGYETVATGLRNSVGFDWRPADGALYATDNGRDLLGDDVPPCELNKIEPGSSTAGRSCWATASSIRTSARKAATRWPRQCCPLTPSARTWPRSACASTAAVGFPERYRGQAFVALHGSWNRTKKSGYKVVLLEWRPDGSIAESDFLTGFEVDENVIGRPVDVLDGPDGALYVSDDFAGAVYRVSPTGAGSE